MHDQSTNRARLEKRAIYIRALEDRIERFIYKTEHTVLECGLVLP